MSHEVKQRNVLNTFHHKLTDIMLPYELYSILYYAFFPEHHSLVGSVADLRTGRWFDPPARLLFFPRINDSHCDRIHSSLTAVRCFDNGYAGKQSVAWKEYFAEHWLLELEESMDRYTGHRDITDILLKKGLKRHTINQSINLRPLRNICTA